MERLTGVTHDIQGQDEKAPWAAQLFGGGGRDYQERYGAKDETFAKISVKARRHAANNPLAIFRDPISLEEVMASPKLYGPLTRSEEHTSELQSLMRISYAVFCLKKNKNI